MQESDFIYLNCTNVGLVQLCPGHLEREGTFTLEQKLEFAEQTHVFWISVI